MNEKTLIIVKPGFSEVEGEIKKRLEEAGLSIIAQKKWKPDRYTLAQHYAEHVTKVWYPEVENYMMESSMLVLVAEGQNTINKVRTVLMPAIRSEFGKDFMRNVLHGSDSLESAKREIKLFFPDLAQ